MVEGRKPEAVERIRHRLGGRLAPALQRSLELGFLGSMPVADQIDHALGFVAILEEELRGAPTSVIDLGTGGGVPGLVLACCWPDSRVVLMDASDRRTTFLLEVLEGWEAPHRAEVVHGPGRGARAEGRPSRGLQRRYVPFLRTASCHRRVWVVVPGGRRCDGRVGTAGCDHRGPLAGGRSGDVGTDHCGGGAPDGTVRLSGPSQDGPRGRSLSPSSRCSGETSGVLIAGIGKDSDRLTPLLREAANVSRETSPPGADHRRGNAAR